jgi:hypothetical protein
MKVIQSVAHSSGAAEQKRLSDNHNTMWWYSRAAAMVVVVKAYSSTQQRRLACSIRLVYKWYYKEFTAAQQCTLLIHTVRSFTMLLRLRPKICWFAVRAARSLLYCPTAQRSTRRKQQEKQQTSKRHSCDHRTALIRVSCMSCIIVYPFLEGCM